MEKNTSVLIVVHGMGDQKRNSVLLGVTRAITGLMKARGRLQPDEDLSVSGDVAFATQSDAQVEYDGRVWRFAEYWWAQSFLPGSDFKIARWIAFGLVNHLRSLRTSFSHAWQDLFQSGGDKDPLIARLYSLYALPAYWFLLLLLSILTPPLMLLLVLLKYVRLIPGVPAFVGYVQSVLSKIGIDMLGDIYVYLEDPLQASLIRDGLVRMIEQAVLDDDVDRIVILAHSTGNLIVYDALAHMRSQPASADIEQKLNTKVKAFISIGSILPMAWNTRIVGEVLPRFRLPMPGKLRWYHLWTRFDVGPAGPLVVPKFVEDGPEVCNRRVNNADDLLLDHTGYWSNIEQVHALALEELGGLRNDNDFWRGQGRQPPGAWQSRSAETWEDFNMRRQMVAEQAMARLSAILTLPMIFSLFMWFNGWAKGVLDFLQIDWLANSFRFAWVQRSLDAPDLSVVGTLGLVTLASLLVFAGVFIIYFAGYKQIWWSLRFRGRRDARHRTFRQRKAAKELDAGTDLQPDGGNA